MSPDHLCTIAACHAQAIDAIRHRYGHATSSHAFNTLYIWRNIVGSQLHLESELFSLRYEAKGSNAWLFPCGDREAAARFIQDHLGETDFLLCYLREEDVQWLQERFPGRFRIQPAEGDSEYIIDRTEQLTLTGKRYEKLRNKLKRIQRDHHIDARLLDEDSIPLALDVISAWHGNRTKQGELHLYGDEEDPDALRQMTALGITGILLYMDGKPCGVAAGYMLSGDTFDLGLAKDSGGDPNLGCCLRHELMRLLPDSVRYVNLEDDLDVPGLRTMKKQMVPIRMNEMWTAVQA